MKGTLLSFEHLQTMLSHKRITVIFDLFFQFCKKCVVIFVVVFFEVASRPIGIIRFYKSGSQRSDPRVAIGAKTVKLLIKKINAHLSCIVNECTA